MKYIKTYENLYQPILVDDVIEKYGNEDAAEFLNYLLKNKEVIINKDLYEPRGTKLKRKKSKNKGVVRNINYFKSENCMGVVFKGNAGTAFVINGTAIYSKEFLDVNDADMLIQSKKYNL
jgi:hypothetical protein